LDTFEIDLGALLDTTRDSAGLPDPGIVNEYTLLQDRRLTLTGEVCLDTIYFSKMLLQWNIEDMGVEPEKRKPIWLYIFSDGGDADVMWSVVDMIIASETPVYTVNFGTCSSAAAYIFMAGHKRYMLKNSHIMIHEGSAGFTGDAGKVRDQFASYDEMLKRLRSYILEQTEIPVKILNRRKNDDWTMDSEEALKYNVCTDIIEKVSDIIVRRGSKIDE